MKKIPLTQGKFAIVDDCDFEELSKYKWFAQKRQHTFYAVRKLKRSGGKQKSLGMHRHIFGDKCIGLDVDHINKNGLDNRRENLRTCTHAENMRNTKRRKNSKTGFIGVYVRPNKKFVAYVRVNKQQIHLGVFDTAIEAAQARDFFAKVNYGEFATLNFKGENNISLPGKCKENERAKTL